jgi:chorismate lyase / 3-hydroxybenzoate synthase
MKASPASGRIAVDAPRIVYCSGVEELPDDTLGALVYGHGARDECAAAGDPRLVGVPLQAMPGTQRVEAWVTRGPVTSGTIDDLHFTSSASHLFGFLEVSEADAGGLRPAAREAYRQLLRFHARGEHRHLWRIWNFIDAINDGAGDEERYRQFCLGRAEGIAGHIDGYPAGTAIGTRTGERRLQLIWLAGRMRGHPIENPRQLSAFRYPRQYGPASPSFSRAMRLGDQLLISGTSSIVGHETVHSGDISAQLAESVCNLQLVAGAAQLGDARLSGLKAYVRREADLALIAAQLRRHCEPERGACVLAADICRSDLLIELEAVALPRATPGPLAIPEHS